MLCGVGDLEEYPKLYYITRSNDPHPRAVCVDFCPPEISDQKAWVKKRKELMAAGQSYDAGQSGNFGLPVVPTYWCDKLQNSITPWVKPKLSTDDLAVGIFTGESLFYGRAAATPAGAAGPITDCLVHGRGGQRRLVTVAAMQA